MPSEPRESPSPNTGQPQGQPPGQPPGILARGLGFARRTARRALWLATLVLLATLAAAWLWPALQDRSHWTIEALNYLAFAIRTLSFHMGLGVIVMIAAALTLRQWRLAAFVLLPTLCFLLPPDALWIARAAPPAASPVSGSTTGSSIDPRPDVIVYSHNAFLGKVDAGAIAATAARHDVDVIVVQEVHAGMMARLTRALAESYPYAAHEEQSAVYGHAVFSRLPFAEPSRAIAFVEPPPDPHPFRMHAGDPQQRVAVRINGRWLFIQNIHFVSPASPTAVAEQGRQVIGLIDALNRDTLLNNDPAPLLLIGDFNSTPRSATHEHLRAAGLREIHDAVGTTRGGTWPAHKPWLPPFLAVRIDNAWINQSIRPRFSITTSGHGSDHRGIIVGFDLK